MQAEFCAWRAFAMAGWKLRTASSRELGGTERNWCLATEGGTGNTVMAFLFGQRLKLDAVEASLRSLLAAQPVLRSKIVERANKKLWFEISDDVPKVKVEVLERSVESVEAEEDADEDVASEAWLAIVEEELNNVELPMPVLQARLYNLPQEDTLLVLKLHAACVDMFGAAAISTHLLRALIENLESDNLEEQFQKLARLSDGKEEAGVDVEEWDLPAIESAIPPEKSKKPFWAHGVDAIGYGLVSRRFANLPFQTPQHPRKSRVIRAQLSPERTKALLQACSDEKTDLYGVFSAVGMKAAAQLKKTGKRGEHYAVAVLYNCRAILEPVIPVDASGFYNSALLRTTHVKESDQMWELAAKCSREFNESIKNKKHFTDIGVLNLLMVQAIHHPNLTPSGSMRTTLMSLEHDAPDVDLSKELSVLKVKDRVTCSSTHGVGPNVALFHFLEEGHLRLCFVFSTPLFSRQYIQTYTHTFLDILNSSF